MIEAISAEILIPVVLAGLAVAPGPKWLSPSSLPSAIPGKSASERRRIRTILGIPLQKVNSGRHTERLESFFGGTAKKFAQPMVCNLSVLLCLLSVAACAVYAKSPGIEPLHVAAGRILSFHVQTRLDPTQGDALNALPEGTILRVKMLDAVDSRVNHDGSKFHGQLAAPLVCRGAVLAPAGSEVKGLLVLLRSTKHPEGFRYELLLVQLTSGDKTYALTASLHSSLLDPGMESAEGRGNQDSEPSKRGVPVRAKSRSAISQ